MGKQLIIPEGTNVDKMVIAPGIDGELGILPRHAPLLTALQVGVLRLKKATRRSSWPSAGGSWT